MGTGSLAATGIRGRDMGNLYCGLCKRPRAAAEFCGHTTGHTGILSSLERAWVARALFNVPLVLLFLLFSAFLTLVFPSNVILTIRITSARFVVTWFFFKGSHFLKCSRIKWKENLVHAVYGRARRIDTLRYLACLVSDRSSLSIDNSDANVIDRAG